MKKRKKNTFFCINIYLTFLLVNIKTSVKKVQKFVPDYGLIDPISYIIRLFNILNKQRIVFFLFKKRIIKKTIKIVEDCSVESCF